MRSNTCHTLWVLFQFLIWYLYQMNSWSIRDSDCSRVLKRKSGTKRFSNCPTNTQLESGRARLSPEPLSTAKIEHVRDYTQNGMWGIHAEHWRQQSKCANSGSEDQSEICLGTKEPSQNESHFRRRAMHVTVNTQWLPFKLQILISSLIEKEQYKG